MLAFYVPVCVQQVRKRKWENYSSGEELFGLKVTAYPELEQTEKEVTMLERLYTWALSGLCFHPAISYDSCVQGLQPQAALVSAV
jgi:hypothetical protein